MAATAKRPKRMPSALRALRLIVSLSRLVTRAIDVLGFASRPRNEEQVYSTETAGRWSAPGEAAGRLGEGDASVSALRARYPPKAARRTKASKSQGNLTEERKEPDHENLGVGRGRVPRLANSAAPVGGGSRGGRRGQLCPQELRQRARGRVPGADRAAADACRG